MSQEIIEQQLPRALLALRLGVFIVMLVWTLDKSERYEQATDRSQIIESLSRSDS